MSTPPENIKIHLRVICQDDFIRRAALYLPYVMGTRDSATFEAFLRAFLTVYFDRWPSPQTGAALVKEMENVRNKVLEYSTTVWPKRRRENWQEAYDLENDRRHRKSLQDYAKLVGYGEWRFDEETPSLHPSHDQVHLGIFNVSDIVEDPEV
ncbi:hypothetical protein BDZ97DRAFT_1916290 [Flammula alnicola]|nr:hypothetical protein BDZ97DRAFT_1916290 [Flammula alnicola]